MSKRYGQFCGLARALDVVGERWSLLIVRELLVRPARYSELSAALPGVATNLLADRLRNLTAAGVVERRLDPDTGGVVYALTPWGAGLREAVDALVRWSTPLMRTGCGGDEFRTPWLAVGLRALLSGRRSPSPVTVGIETAESTLVIVVDETGPRVELDPDSLPRTVLHADPQVVLGLAAGALSVDDAVARGQLRGIRDELAAVFGAADAASRSPTTSG